MTALTLSERRRLDRQEEERDRLHELLTNEAASLKLGLAAKDTELRANADAAAKLAALQAPAAELPPEVYTLGRASMLGMALPSGRVRDFIGLALSEGLGHLATRRTKTEAQRKIAADRLAVVERELAEKFDAAAE